MFLDCIFPENSEDKFPIIPTRTQENNSASW